MRFYHRVSGELKRRGINFSTLKAGEEIPPGVSVVLTAPEDSELTDFPVVVAEEDCALAVEKAVRILRGFKERHERITVGIDPGKTPGVAVVADNRAVDAFMVSSPEEIRGVVERVMAIHSPEKLLVRLGTGGGGYRQRILRSLLQVPELEIEMVREDSTSRGNARHERNATAALSIALSKGTPLETDQLLGAKIRPGEIKNIQREARRLVPGLTISKKLAEKVARGEMSLREAAVSQKRKSS
jgi:hypothetical protein